MKKKKRPKFVWISPPSKGWVNTIRTCLCMRQNQLAKKLGCTQATVACLEKSERAGTITLSSLMKIAEALNCYIHYEFVRRDIPYGE